MKTKCLLLTAILSVGFSVLAKDDGNGPHPSTILSPRVKQPQTGVQATVSENKIELSDGRTFELLKSASKYITAEVVVTAPAGATVTIEYEDGKDTFTGKVPFVYKAPPAKSNEYFKLTVKEGGADQIWHVNLQHESNTILTIQ